MFFDNLSLIHLFDVTVLIHNIKASKNLNQVSQLFEFKMLKAANILILCSIFLATCYSKNIVDYRLTVASDPVLDCYQKGHFCESCTSLVSCQYEAANNSYSKTSRTSCPKPQKCLNKKNSKNQVEGQCSSDIDPICDNIIQVPFECTTEGIFPDPFYFNKFVMCVKDPGLKPFSATCPSGYGFNVKTDLCDCKLSPEGQCGEEPYPIPVCQEANEAKAIEGKPALYYTCDTKTTKSGNAVLYPVQRICLGQETYSDYSCSNPNGEDGSTTIGSTTN